MGSVLLVGDVHLGHASRDAAAGFHAFLAGVPVSGDHLVITGDLFDFLRDLNVVRNAFPACGKQRYVRLRTQQLVLKVLTEPGIDRQGDDERRHTCRNTYYGNHGDQGNHGLLALGLEISDCDE